MIDPDSKLYNILSYESIYNCKVKRSSNLVALKPRSCTQVIQHSTKVIRVTDNILDPTTDILNI